MSAAYEIDFFKATVQTFEISNGFSWFFFFFYFSIGDMIGEYKMFLKTQPLAESSKLAQMGS